MLNKLNSIYSITITSKVQLQSRKKTPSFQGVAFFSNKIFRFCEYYVFMFLCFQLNETLRDFFVISSLFSNSIVLTYQN